MKKGIPIIPQKVYITLPKKFYDLDAKKLDKVNSPPKNAQDIAVNFEIYDPKDNKVEEFDEPFELRVRYTAAQANNVNGAANLILKYDDGTGWKTFTNTVDMISHGKGRGGWGVVLINHWDPQVAWFP